MCLEGPNQVIIVGNIIIIFTTKKASIFSTEVHDYS